MKSYLSHRTQVVSINGKTSSASEVTCGVPQGSVLGLLLLLMFINDLPLILLEKVHSADLYADDTTIYNMQPNLEVLRLNLQHSLIKLQTWCKQNDIVPIAEKNKSHADYN